MTIYTIDGVVSVIAEMQGKGDKIGSVWEYINRNNNKIMFALFLASQYCDIYESPAVRNPTLIWHADGEHPDGHFIGACYEYLNEDE